MSIQQVLNIQALVLGYEMEKYTLFVAMCNVGNMFKQRTRVFNSTFKNLCEKLIPHLKTTLIFNFGGK